MLLCKKVWNFYCLRHNHLYVIYGIWNEARAILFFFVFTKRQLSHLKKKILPLPKYNKQKFLSRRFRLAFSWLCWIRTARCFWNVVQFLRTFGANLPVWDFHDFQALLTYFSLLLQMKNNSRSFLFSTPKELVITTYCLDITRPRQRCFILVLA